MRKEPKAAANAFDAELRAIAELWVRSTFPNRAAVIDAVVRDRMCNHYSSRLFCRIDGIVSRARPKRRYTQGLRIDVVRRAERRAAERAAELQRRSVLVFPTRRASSPADAVDSGIEWTER